MSDQRRSEPSVDYASYLLRRWRAPNSGLEEPLIQPVERFDTPPGLFAFLLLPTGQGGSDDGRERETARPGALCR